MIFSAIHGGILTRNLLGLCAVVLSVLLPIRPAFACLDAGMNSTYLLGIALATPATALHAGLSWLIAWIISKLFFSNEVLRATLQISIVLQTLLVSLIGFFVVPVFKDIYESIGAVLPAPTIELINYHLFLWVPFALVSIIFLMKGRTIGTHFLYFLLVFAVALVFLVISILYVPVVKLGCVA